MHKTAEAAVQLREQNKLDSFNPVKDFLANFKEEIEILREALEPEKLASFEKLVVDMITQGRDLAELILPALEENFPGYKLVSVEEYINQEIQDYTEHPLRFTGLIDLMILTPDGKLHIIDWKTSTWGWDARKKSDKLFVYQLSFYKKFLCQMCDVDPKDVETHFILLKRTPKTKKIEVVRVTNGPKRIENAHKALLAVVKNLNAGKVFKNRLNCKWCEFYKTEHCR